MSSRVISTILNLKDNMSGPLLKVSKGTKNISKELKSASRTVTAFSKNAKRQFESLGDKTVKVGAVMVASIGALALKKGFSEAFDMEGYRVQLETATKDTVKAGKLMSDAVAFANKTPFETGEVVQATAKMEMYGLSSSRWLADVADMAGSTNKSIDQATEAMADIAVGEFERIKEFGLKKDMILAKSNEKYGEGVVINAKGQVVDQAKLMDVVQGMMQDKFKGGAEKLAGTTKGLWSTITGVTKSSLAKIIGMQEDGTVKQGSLLKKVKGKVKQVADQIQKWQSNGTMDKVAVSVTKAFDKTFKAVSKVFKFLKDNKEIITNVALTFASLYIAIKVIKGIQLAMFGLKLAISGVQVMMAILNGTLVISPFGWVAIAITALIVGFALLYKNSSRFREGVSSLIEMLKALGTSVIAIVIPVIKDMLFVIKSVISAAIEIFKGLIQFIVGMFTNDWSLAWKGIVSIFSGIFNGIKNIATGVINTIIDSVNGLTGALSKIPGVNIPSIKRLGGTALKSNKGGASEYADGTQSAAGGISLVGERGPELVNLKRGDSVTTARKTSEVLNGDGKKNIFVFNFNGNIGEEEFFEKAGNHIVKKIQLTMANV